MSIMFWVGLWVISVVTAYLIGRGDERHLCKFDKLLERHEELAIQVGRVEAMRRKSGEVEA